tara:strand:- start:250 stop:1203 length:954 start_codon:yes stop_codon:yes gene_type:complete
MIKDISKFCLGTWSLGGATKGASSYGKISEKLVEKILDLSFEKGINTFDTASVYGKSEKLLGKFIKNKRDKIKIASKIGCTSYFKKINFEKKTILHNLELSLRNLKTDYIDICQLYNPNPQDKKLLSAIEYLQELKKKGKIKYLGVSLQNPSDYLYLRKNFKFDMIQCNFNMLDQRLLENKILKKMTIDKVSIFVRTVLNFGFFTESIINKKKISFKKNDHRSRWNKSQVENWHVFSKKIADNFDLNIEDLAIRFIMSQKLINSVIIGVMNIDQLNKLTKLNNLKSLKDRDLRIINNIYKLYEKNRLLKPKIPMKSR